MVGSKTFVLVTFIYFLVTLSSTLLIKYFSPARSAFSSMMIVISKLGSSISLCAHVGNKLQTVNK